MILPILTAPHPILSKKAEVVIDWQPISQLTQDMLDTMYNANGIGLAAPQIGLSLRLVVIDVRNRGQKSKLPYVLINPVLLKKKGVQLSREGCLSLPGRDCRVQRAAEVEVLSHDVHGRPYRFKAQGLLAACIQHELDHLDGVLMSDVEERG